MSEQGKPYGKIETLFERDEKFKVIEGNFKRPVIETISLWRATEKVDGTNIRIHYTTNNMINGVPHFNYVIGGRTDKAQIPVGVIDYIHKLDHKAVQATMESHGLESMTLYGEGYGPGIQKGGGDYADEQKFILFDIRVGDHWLTDAVVLENAYDWGMKSVPILGEFSIPQMVEMVKNGIPSWVAEDPKKEKWAEGIVARPLEPLYDQRGERLIVKIKTKDFE